MGLPEDVDAATRKISQIIVALNMAQIGLNSLLSGLITMNPFQIGIGVAGLVGSGLSFSDVMAGY